MDSPHPSGASSHRNILDTNENGQREAGMIELQSQVPIELCIFGRDVLDPCIARMTLHNLMPIDGSYL